MNGSITRRCGCRNPQTGAHYNASCPKLTDREHGTWTVRQELHPDGDGKRRTFRRSGFKTEPDAQKEMDTVRALLALADEDNPQDSIAISDMIAACAKSKTNLPTAEEVARRFKAGQALNSRMSIAEWLDLWLAGKKKLRPTGKTRYEMDIRVHLKPHIGGIRLDRLCVQHLDQMFTAIDDRNEEILEQNAQRRQALNDLKEIRDRAARRVAREAIAQMPPFRRVTGPSTQQHIRATLRTALNAAIAQQYIDFNAAEHVEVTSAVKPKALVWTPEHVAHWKKTGEKPSPVMVWTPAQTGTFLDSVANDRLYALWHLITFRGLRRGEGCGARWTALAKSSNTLSVASQLVQNGWEVLEGAPKTNSGIRTVALDPESMEVLRQHELRQKADRLRFGPAWVDTGLIFTMEDGTWLHPGKISDRFARLVADAGLPPIRLHDLRHGAATLALAAGIDIKVVSEMLGHSDTRVTLNIYQSVLPEMAHDAAEAVVRLVPRRGKPAAGESS
ncbi:tyrosine recombinase XerC [Kitasatospora sp. GAS1066B]|uniref:site-specific integrase n=1 Tax=Kitasatospora sp. GAS1066B TaxID=3156271 RepID=UPI00351291F2